MLIAACHHRAFLLLSNVQSDISQLKLLNHDISKTVSNIVVPVHNTQSGRAEEKHQVEP